MSSSCQKICECGLIDWSGGPGEYKYVDTGKLYDPFILNGYDNNGDPIVSLSSKVRIDCQAKVNANLMSGEEYDKVCQYIPGRPGSKFPVAVYNKLLE